MTAPRKRLRTVADGWVPLRHGIPSSYNRGCRCDECRNMHALRIRTNGSQAAHRNRNLAKRVAVAGYLIAPERDDQHGSHDTYTRYGCRCLACVRANAEYHRQWRATRTGPGGAA